MPDCPYCLDAGFAPVPTDTERYDWAVCLCRAGKRWRYADQTDKRGRAHRVQPMWKLWEAEHKTALAGARVAPVEDYYSEAEIRRLFKL